MNLKNLLLSGALTVVVAFVLLTVLAPQTSAAGPPEYKFACYSCPTFSPWVPPAPHTGPVPLTKADAERVWPHGPRLLLHHDSGNSGERVVQDCLHRLQLTADSAQAAALRARAGASTNVVAQFRPGEPTLGAAASPVAMIEYSDFQCPYCALFRADAFPKIKEKYIDSGRLRFIHRHLPSPAHRHARDAAEAAFCAGDQGLYWEFSRVLFSRSACLECQGIMEISRAVPLDSTRFGTCISSNAHRSDVDRDIAGAAALDVHGTPSFVVGRVRQSSVEGVKFSGVRSFEEFESIIDRFLTL